MREEKREGNKGKKEGKENVVEGKRERERKRVEIVRDSRGRECWEREIVKGYWEIEKG